MVVLAVGQCPPTTGAQDKPPLWQVGQGRAPSVAIENPMRAFFQPLIELMPVPK
jgi:hypothetical protein